MLSPTELKEYHKRYSEGEPIRDLADEIDYHVGTLRRWFKEADLEVGLQQGKWKRKKGKGRKYSLNHTAFDKIDNEETAYWLGFTLADGYISEDGLAIKLKATDASHLKKLCDFLDYEGKVFLKERNSGYGGGCGKYAQLRIASQRLKKGLVKHLGEKKTKIPELETHLKKHFIRGLYDGDGCPLKPPTENGNYPRGFQISCEKFIGDWLLKQYPEGNLRQDTGIHRFSTYRSKNVYDLYKGATIYLERKFKKVKEFTTKERRYL